MTELKTLLIILTLTIPATIQSHTSHKETSAEVRPQDNRLQPTLSENGDLKSRLLTYLNACDDNIDTKWTPWSLATWFKGTTEELSDRKMYEKLVEIYHEANSQGTNESLQLMIRAVTWLGVCNDSHAKAFLYDVLTNSQKDSPLRVMALASYLKNASPNDTRNVLLKMLVDEDHEINSILVYSQAVASYQRLPSDDVIKRRAILSALMVAAANEEKKIGFVLLDRMLAMRSEAYRHSRERLALLERHSLAPPTRNLYTDADLESALAEMRKRKSFTSVNTNATLLRTRDFDSEIEPGDLEMWGGRLRVPTEEELLAPRRKYPDEPATSSPQGARWLLVIPVVLVFIGGICGIRLMWRKRR